MTSHGVEASPKCRVVDGVALGEGFLLLEVEDAGETRRFWVRSDWTLEPETTVVMDPDERVEHEDTIRLYGESDPGDWVGRRLTLQTGEAEGGPPPVIRFEWDPDPEDGIEAAINDLTAEHLIDLALRMWPDTLEETATARSIERLPTFGDGGQRVRIVWEGDTTTYVAELGPTGWHPLSARPNPRRDGSTEMLLLRALPWLRDAVVAAHNECFPHAPARAEDITGLTLTVDPDMSGIHYGIDLPSGNFGTSFGAGDFGVDGDMIRLLALVPGLVWPYDD